MNKTERQLVHEQSSPLFRIMSVYDDTDPTKRQFEANISAFHIGNGVILSVAHYLFQRSPLIPSAPDPFFRNEILAKFSATDANHVKTLFHFDSATKKWRAAIADEKVKQDLTKRFETQKCDTRLQTLHANAVCKPFLILNFENNQIFNNSSITSQLNPAHILHEPFLRRYTFLLELELVSVFPRRDIAIYRLVNAPSDLARALPSIPVDYQMYDDRAENLYCLQSSPSNSNLGRLLNRAWIDGILDQHGVWPDGVGGTHVIDGMRYLIRGYFRFGSSGAPYIKFNNSLTEARVIAIQSEACPIQLAIKNDREGNFQYVNALATPLQLVESELRDLQKVN